METPANSTEGHVVLVVVRTPIEDFGTCHPKQPTPISNLDKALGVISKRQKGSGHDRQIAGGLRVAPA
jgi:hypothetical protein